MTWLPQGWAAICCVFLLLQAYGQEFGLRETELMIEFSGLSAHLLNALCADLYDKGLYSSGVCYHPPNTSTTADAVDVPSNHIPEPTTLFRPARNESPGRMQTNLITSHLLNALCADLHDKGLYSSGICYNPPDISTTADTVEMSWNHTPEPITFSRAARKCLSVKNSWSLIIVIYYMFT